MNETSGIKFEANPYHNIVLKDRKHLEISGVKEMEHFDEEEFLLETVQGWIEIEGSDLTLDRLDKERGEVIIKGTITGMRYVSGKKNKESLVSRLFK